MSTLDGDAAFSHGAVRLVAGITGTLGRAIASEFLRHWRPVRGVARTEPIGLAKTRLEASLRSVDVIYGDLLDARFTAKACEGVDTVVFAAGVSGVATSFAEPVDSLVASAVPWLNVLRSVAPGTRVILLSSQTVYGPSDGKPFTTDSPARPASPYALHRALMEDQGRMLCGRYGVEIVVLRLGNVFGEVLDITRERTHGVVERMLQDLVRKNTAELYGGGRQSLEVLHADDLARAVAELVRTRPTEGRFVVFNLSGQRVTVRQIADALCVGLGRGRPVSVPWEPGMERAMAKDVELDDLPFRAIYGWRPTADVLSEAEKLARTWKECAPPLL